MGEVKLLTSGFRTSIQDQGRFGFAKFGVPRSGAMDLDSYNRANLLLGNDENSACIEFAFQGPVLQFFEESVVVLTGANVIAFLNGDEVEMCSPFKVNVNDVLKIGMCKNGVYGYVGIMKGFLTPLVLGSRSFYSPVTDTSLLKSGSKISYKKKEVFTPKFSSISVSKLHEKLIKIEVLKGTEFELLSRSQKEVFYTSNFTISNTLNRMAIRLVEKLENQLPSMLTSPVLPGTIQLTPAGDLVILMRDAQTTGGYPRILQLTESSINKIAQLRMGKQLKFILS